MCPHCSSPQQQPRSPSLPSPPGESAVQKKLTGGGCSRPARVFTGSDFCTNKVIRSWDFEKCAWMTWISGSTASVETCLHWQLNSETSRSERSRQTLKAVCNQKLGFALITLNFFDCWLQVILVFGDSNSSCERAFSVIDWWQTLSYCSFVVVFMHHRVLADLVPMVGVAISKATRPIRSKKTDEWETWDDHRRRTSENRTDSKEELHCCASSSEAWRVSIHSTLQSEAFGFAQIMCQLI